ncbi:MAG: TRAP transporter large permease subunit [Thermoanaerobaculia bacterium]
MSEAVAAPHSVTPHPTASKRNFFRASEEYVLLGALLLLALVPIVEIVLRRWFGFGISGSSAIVQHLTLVGSMLGAALAAREGRLLSIATAAFMTGSVRQTARFFSAVVAASITTFLCAGSWVFVMAQGRRQILAYGIPTWVVQLVLPAGFAIIALRLLWNASERPGGRIAAFLAAAALTALYVWSPLPVAPLATVALVLLFAAVVAGAPIFVMIGGAALILFWRASEPIAAVAVGHYSLVVNPSIPAIPLFTLAGYLLAEGGASRRLVAVFTTLFSHVRGGAAVVTALACAFFTTFTGGSGVTILALGGLLYPVLRQAGYTDRNSLGLITGAGSLGILFPPCLPLILYAIVAQVRMEEMFLGGILPGVVLLLIVAAWGTRHDDGRGRAQPFDGREALRAIWIAKWELLLPVVVIFVLFAGFATPVEAAAFTALYAFVIETFVYRDYRTMASLAHVVREAGLLIGGVLLILGVALGFTNFLIDMEIPSRAVSWATSSIESPWVFLLLLNVFLLIVGALMDIFPAIVVVVPLIVPLGTAFGIDPIHLGIVFLANLELGFLMPPIGLNLLISAYRFEKPITEVYRASFPILIVLLGGVLLITYVPWLTTFLPRVLLN